MAWRCAIKIFGTCSNTQYLIHHCENCREWYADMARKRCNPYYIHIPFNELQWRTRTYAFKHVLKLELQHNKMRTITINKTHTRQTANEMNHFGWMVCSGPEKEKWIRIQETLNCTFRKIQSLLLIERKIKALPVRQEYFRHSIIKLLLQSYPILWSVLWWYFYQWNCKVAYHISRSHNNRRKRSMIVFLFSLEDTHEKCHSRAQLSS